MPRLLAQDALHALRGRPAPIAPGPVATSELPPASGLAESSLDPARPPKGPDAPRYVGGIR
jgi:hypothetical protein